MKKYLKLFRVKHYIKNILIFTTIIFSGQVFTMNFYKIFIGFIAFCFVSSCVYIINDLVDYEIDKKTESKKNEPLARNIISKRCAFILCMILFFASAFINYFIGSLSSYICIFIYFILNVFYSFIGKKIPYVELLIMTVFYLLRVYYGALILKVSVSLVLILTVIFGTIYIVSMKRMIEIKNKKYRKVFQIYKENHLRILSFLALFLMICCYIFWIFIEKNPLLISTLILVVIIFIRYDKKVAYSIDGNPVEVLLKDRVLTSLSVIYGIMCIVLFEFN